MIAAKERNHLFDNLKGLMLILVAVGHILDPYIVEQDSLYRYLMQYIYLFHMPMFAFVTGYFSKNTEKGRATAVQNVLVPYLFWQILYIGVALASIALHLANYNVSVFHPSILLPTSPLYYLLCVFVWKLIATDLKKMGFVRAIILSVVSGALISTIANEEFHIGWGATLSLMIFFVLGLYCTPEHIEKIRRIPHIAAVAVLLLAIIPATQLPYCFRNVRFTYASVGLSNGMGILYRLLFFAIAIVMILAFINLFSAKRTPLAPIGENAILVYAGSSFASPTLYLLIAGIFSLDANPAVNLICMVLFSILLTRFCAMNWIKRIYDWIMGHITHFLFPNTQN